MKDALFVLASITLALMSWGLYGPMLREGQSKMGSNHLLPFICVGVAYFLIAVVVPTIMLRIRGEKGHWTTSGIIWSLAAGTAGALGALGIILAFDAGGKPIFVMPLVFGGAPVVNTFYTMYTSKTFRHANPIFYAGLILVIVGAITVLSFNPAARSAPRPGEHEIHWVRVFLFVALTVLSWGVYGPVLHKGQMFMEGSRLRPLLCVGLAYFLVAVIVPSLLIPATGRSFDFTFLGSMWSLAGGSVGALGALGIIMAFNFGGKPIYVMPLVFGGAPVVNTLTTIFTSESVGEISPFFYAGLIVVVAGAATVLVFSPKSPHAPAPGAKPSIAK